MRDVLAVIEMCRDGWGDLDDAGRALEESRLYALRAQNPGVDEAVRQQANRVRSERESLRSAGLVPVIRR